ncbi:vitellogenin-like [Antedon mediterranea]|uniref:vitellogenin-like n=1 Tax=Antedon mediterranea TaxID=105859 RepID=UPI003AF92B6C
MRYAVFILLSATIVGLYAQFSPNKVLWYNYEGELLTGIPGTSQEHSGLKIICTVLIQQDLNTVRMKLSEVSLKYLQEKVTNPVEKVNDELFTDTSEEELWRLTEQLQKPTQFQYRRGLISDIEGSIDEPHWSVNIKRGVLNLLQVNLEGRNRVDDRPVDINRAGKDDHILGDKLFKVIEEGISGECESQYVIKSWKSIPDYNNGQLTETKKGYNVTKVINYDNCKTRSLLTTTSVRGFKCARCNDQNLLKSDGLIRQNIIREQDGDVIESVIAEGQHVFTPYRTEDGGIVTFIKQMLRLTILEREDIQPDQLIPEPENKQLKGGLKYVFQKTSEEEDLSNDINDVTSTNTEVIHLLKLLSESVLKNELTKATPEFFLQLIQRLRKCTLVELQNIMEEFEEELPHFKDQKRITDKDLYDLEKKMKIQSRRFLHDALPLVSTISSNSLIKTLIEEKKITGEAAIQILSSTALTAKPTQQFVNKTRELCTSKAVIANIQLRATCLLSFGSLVNTLCTGEQQQRNCQAWIRESHKEFLLTGIQLSQPRHVQLMHLKAIGNAGMSETINDLQQLIESTNADVELRVTAVYALRRMTILQQNKVNIILFGDSS